MTKEDWGWTAGNKQADLFKPQWAAPTSVSLEQREGCKRCIYTVLSWLRGFSLFRSLGFDSVICLLFSFLSCLKFLCSRLIMLCSNILHHFTVSCSSFSMPWWDTRRGLSIIHMFILSHYISCCSHVQISLIIHNFQVIVILLWACINPQVSDWNILIV